MPICGRCVEEPELCTRNVCKLALPKYNGGVVKYSSNPCFCLKVTDLPVFNWKPNVQGSNMNMDAHEECFHNLWAGEYY